MGLQLNDGKVFRNGWHHVAVVRKSNNIRIYIDGMLSNYTTDNNSATLDLGFNGTNIGKNFSGHYVNGKISNLRVVKGQAIYETNFVVPQSPLTTTSQGATASNVKLLCCNTSTTTGSTVTPGTITANGDAAVNSNNPFMDANSKIFGNANKIGLAPVNSKVMNPIMRNPNSPIATVRSIPLHLLATHKKASI